MRRPARGAYDDEKTGKTRLRRRGEDRQDDERRKTSKEGRKISTGTRRLFDKHDS